MIKSFLFPFLLMTVLLIFPTSCETKKKDLANDLEQPVSLIDNENGKYIEYYPGRKKIKIQGRLDSNGDRTGIWKLFSENGIELSVTIYSKGKKDGHIIVKYPNGVLNYVGEYRMDERIGEWTFYNEQGELIEKKVYNN